MHHSPFFKVPQLKVLNWILRANLWSKVNHKIEMQKNVGMAQQKVCRQGKMWCMKDESKRLIERRIILVPGPEEERLVHTDALPVN